MLLCEHCQQEHDEGHAVCPITGKLFRPERLFPLGTLLEGKYRIDEVLGAGGMGAVFRATHTLLNKPVAVKVTLPQLARDEQVKARMVREARVASATGHRNIASVTDMGWTQDGGLFLVMEYLRGRTLYDLVGLEGPLETTRAVGLTMQILSGLSSVHAQGVVHRDLKPENVMVVRDEEGQELVKVLDFGISKVLGGDQALELTQTGMVMGSPRYMSPEQARGQRDLDQRVDIYATGGILFTLLVGAPPLSAPNYHAMLAAVLAGNIPRPSDLAPSIPRALDAIVLRAMSLDARQRYADAVSFRQALVPFASVAEGGEGTVPAGRGTADLTAVDGGASLDLDALSDDALVALDEVAEPVRASVGAPAAKSPAVMTGAVPGASPQQKPAHSGIRATSDRPAGVGARAEPQSLALAADSAGEKFGPKAEEVEALELDMDDGWRGGPSGSPARSRPGAEAHRGGTLYEQRGKPLAVWVTRAATLGLLVALAVAGWWAYSHYLSDGFEAVGSTDEAVMVLLETEPRNAEVYVDGVLQVTSPIELPRSDGLYALRVSAPGYRSKTLQLRADRTHAVRVELERAP